MPLKMCVTGDFVTQSRTCWTTLVWCGSVYTAHHITHFPIARSYYMVMMTNPEYLKVAQHLVAYVKKRDEQRINMFYK